MTETKVEKLALVSRKLYQQLKDNSQLDANTSYTVDAEDLTDLVSKSEMDEAIAAKQSGIDESTLNNKLSAYALKTDVHDISGLATKEEVATAVQGFAKSTDVESTYAKKTDIPQVPDTSEFITTTQADDKYATKEAVSAVAGLDAETVKNLKDLATDLADGELESVSNALKEVYNKTEVDDKLSTKADASAIPSIEGLAKESDVEANYAKKTDIPDVSTLATKSELEVVINNQAEDETKYAVKATEDEVKSLKETIKTLEAKLALIPEVGPTESRPSENLVAGKIYYDTTTKTMYIYDGSEWDTVNVNVSTLM